MEKKEYINPEITAIDLEMVEMIATSIYIDGKGEAGKDQLSNSYRPGRRGEWGNLWAQGEE